MKKIYLCVNRGDKHKELVEKLIAAVNKLIKNKDVEITIHDIGLYGEISVDGPVFIFGQFAKSEVENNNNLIFYMPSLEELEDIPGNKHSRRKGTRILKEGIEEIFSIKNIEETNINNTYFVEKKNTKIGFGSNIDIEIPEDKLESLQRMKNLLNAKKIIIEKGDTKIEFEC